MSTVSFYLLFVFLWGCLQTVQLRSPAGFSSFYLPGFFISYPTVENRKKPQKTPSMPLTFTSDLGILNAHDAG